MTYVSNALFMATNMIGDILLHHKECLDEKSFSGLCSTHITHLPTLSFFIDRVIDAVVIALIGNSRDEGLLSIYRKLIMIGINDRRGHLSFTFSIGGLCDKINECLMDNPFGMRLIIAYRFSLCYP